MNYTSKNKNVNIKLKVIFGIKLELKKLKLYVIVFIMFFQVFNINLSFGQNLKIDAELSFNVEDLSVNILSIHSNKNESSESFLERKEDFIITIFGDSHMKHKKHN